MQEPETVTEENQGWSKYLVDGRVTGPIGLPLDIEKLQQDAHEQFLRAAQTYWDVLALSRHLAELEQPAEVPELPADRRITSFDDLPENALIIDRGGVLALFQPPLSVIECGVAEASALEGEGLEGWLVLSSSHHPLVFPRSAMHLTGPEQVPAETELEAIDAGGSPISMQSAEGHWAWFGPDQDLPMLADEIQFPIKAWKV